jgi:pimeloyl-ACP methyl ester carboxylesterase
VKSRDGVLLAAEVIGEGEPVTVLAHGLTGTRGDVRIFAPFLPGTKVLFDFRGHGESERPGPGSYAMDAFAGDVDEVARAFDATAIAGTSLGGGAALRLLCSDPGRFERLVFLLPARLERSSKGQQSLLRLADALEQLPIEEAADLVLAEEEREGAFEGFTSGRDTRRQSILAMNGDGVPNAIRESIDDPPVRDPEPITRVQAPALVIGQHGDPVHTAEVSRELADALPNSELVLFEDRFAMMREVPVLVQRVSAFLAGP